jgi:dTDP-4-dehydrorhamnose reductase
MSVKKNVLITGSNGQLGNELQVLAPLYPQYNFIFVNRHILPIDDLAAVSEFFAENAIDYCINCAAYTAVDKAETETDAAELSNGTAVGHLAKLCSQQDAVFIHISTDYVFDGKGTSPYVPTHPVSPVNAYGASKLLGEQLAMNSNPNSIIIRTSWVYSSFGNNFVKTMLRLMKDRPQLNVVEDQQGCPTYAADLAKAILKIAFHPDLTNIIAAQRPAIYHYSNKDATNWYLFAKAIGELSGSQCQVSPIPSAQYPTPARRPAYSVMDTSRIENDFGIQIPVWQDSLKKCLDILLSA